MYWYVLLLLVSVGLLFKGGMVEVEKGFWKALPWALPGFVGLIWSFYLYALYLFPFIMSQA